MGKPDRLGCGASMVALGVTNPGALPDDVGARPSRPGTIRKEPAPHIVDITPPPAALRHLGLDAAGMDGAPLQHQPAAADTQEMR